MIFKKLFFGACHMVEIAINLIIFVYGPYMVYRAMDVGEYVSGILLLISIGLVAAIDYHDERIRKTVIGKFFHMLIFWEGVKHKAKRLRRKDG